MGALEYLSLRGGGGSCILYSVLSCESLIYHFAGFFAFRSHNGLLIQATLLLSSILSKYDRGGVPPLPEWSGTLTAGAVSDISVSSIMIMIMIMNTVNSVRPRA